MNRKIVVYVLLSLILTMTFIGGCSQPQSSEEPSVESGKANGNDIPESERFLSIGASDPGTSFYALGSGIATVIQREIPGTTVNVEVTGSAVENVRLLDAGQVDFGFTVSMIPYQGINEEGMDNVNMAFAYLLTSFKIITRESSDINSIEDLRGKRVAIGAPGSSTATEAEIVLDEYGIGLDGIRAERLNIAESADALKDGNIDAFFLNIADPAAVVTDLATTHDIKFIPYEGPTTQQILSKHDAFVEAVIPAGTYPNQEEDVTTIGSNMVLMTRGDLSEELVYRVIKALFENQETLIDAHPVGRGVVLENALRARGLPYHPGAVKYYKEMGVWVD